MFVTVNNQKMDCISEMKEIISCSSTSSSDKGVDPDYCESPLRQLHQNRTSSFNKNKNTQIQNVQRKRRVRNEGLSLNRRRSTRRRTNNPENKSEVRQIRRTVLSWLIDTKVIQQNTRVFSALKEGLITRDGILCGCCNKFFTAMDFEIHGGSDLKRPYENIFIEETHVSLLSCLREAWYKTKNIGHERMKKFEDKCRANDKHDDACMICADGGNLLCCDICPSTYHQHCMDIDVVPEGSWLCPYCVCKFCGKPCAAKDYLITCFQCEKKYHWECNQERNLEPVALNSSGTPLCEQSCKEAHRKLEKMVGVRKELDEGFSWTLLRQMDDEFGVWLNDLYQVVECHSKLAVAKNVMEECFEPIRDRYTRIDVIQSVLFNRQSHFTRINFRGFYTAILEKDDGIISVASVRIHGTKLAEMPFIATRENYRGQGMCRRLMVAIESALCYLKVENLLIPSIQERIGTWIERYGFERIGTPLTKEIMNRHTLTFHDSIRLQKILAVNGAGEVQEAENNDHQNEPGVVDLNLESPMQAVLDLNLEPPEED